ncbi:MAG TPA: hypothetical protein ENK36_06500 [Desulfobacterales bacterium]|nr:hypothetical protein [Desulfobacterales bacterium]
MNTTNDSEKESCQIHSHEVNGNKATTHSCSHHHVHVKDTSGSRLLMTLVLNFIIPVIQNTV